MGDETKGGLERGVLEHHLEGERGVVKMGVQGGGKADSNDARGYQALRLPNVKWHDWVVDLALNDNKQNQRGETDNKRSQGLGDTPSSCRSLAEVVDNTNNADSKCQQSSKVDAAVCGLGLALLSWDDQDSERYKEEANDTSHVKDPAPSYCRAENTAEQDTHNGSNSGGSTKHAKSSGACRTHWISGSEDSESTRNCKASTHALESATNREHDGSLGGAVDDGPDREPGNTENKDVSVTKEITETAAEEKEGSISQSVSRRNPLELVNFVTDIVHHVGKNDCDTGDIDYVEGLQEEMEERVRSCVFCHYIQICINKCQTVIYLSHGDDSEKNSCHLLQTLPPGLEFSGCCIGHFDRRGLRF